MYYIYSLFTKKYLEFGGALFPHHPFHAFLCHPTNSTTGGGDMLNDGLGGELSCVSTLSFHLRPCLLSDSWYSLSGPYNQLSRKDPLPIW